jgi:hypothetical protein
MNRPRHYRSDLVTLVAGLIVAAAFLFVFCRVAHCAPSPVYGRNHVSTIGDPDVPTIARQATPSTFQRPPAQPTLNTWCRLASESGGSCQGCVMLCIVQHLFDLGGGWGD